MSLVQFRPEASISGFSSFGRARPCQGRGGGFDPRNPLQKKRVRRICIVPAFIRRHSQAVRQRSAKPSSPVRFRVSPPCGRAPKNEPLCFIFGALTIIYVGFYENRCETANTKSAKNRSEKIFCTHFRTGLSHFSKYLFSNLSGDVFLR